MRNQAEYVRENVVLDIKQLEVVYGHVATAIQGVSLSVNDGEIVSLIGTNGAGKTTTLRAITGFLQSEDVQITDGTLQFQGVNLRGRLPHEISRAGAVLVPDHSKIFQTMTVRDNLNFNFGRKNRHVQDQIFHYFPRLAERQDQIAGLMSGGEKQMLAVGMALMCEPTLLLVDELSLGLAPVVTEEIMAILQTINSNLGLSMLIVEQNAVAALNIAGFGYVMEGGRVVYEGFASDLKRHQDIQEFYLGGAEDKSRSYRDVKQYSRKRRWWG